MSQNSALSQASSRRSFASDLRDAHLRRRGVIAAMPTLATIAAMPTLTVVPDPEPEIAPVAPEPELVVEIAADPEPEIAPRKVRAPRKPRTKPSEPVTVAPAVAESVGPVTSYGLDARFITKDLRTALCRVCAVADKRSAMPILGHTHIRVQSGRAELVATDLNLSITVPLRAMHIRGIGAVVIPAHQALGITKAMTAVETTIAKSDTRARLSSGRSTFEILAQSPGDFPKVPDATADDLMWSECDAGMLASMIKRCRDSVCRDQTRFHLNGGFLECDGVKARLTTTDGHRLTSVEEAFTGPRIPGVIIPERGLAELAKLATYGDRLDLAVARGTMFARQKDGATLTIKLIDAQFPPYGQVIPKDHRTLVSVDRVEFIAALKRSLLVTSETRGVKIEVHDGEVTISADDGDGAHMTESVEANISRETKACTGFNPGYFIDAISPLACDRITLALGSERDPILIRSSEWDGRPVMDASCLVVVMPMRI